MTRRVVITGMGILSPLGHGIEANWQRLMTGKSAITKNTRFAAEGLTSQVAGLVPYGTNPGEFNPDAYLSAKEQRHIDTFLLYGYAAAVDAVHDSGFVPATDAERERCGVLIGSGIGGLVGLEAASIVVHEEGQRKLSPFLIPSVLINLISGHVAIKFGFCGPNSSVTTACATGTHAIGDAARLIRDGEADVMVTGGAEAAVCAVGIAGFAQARALSTAYNETPEVASRPWDKGRDGFVMGEGAGMLVLEEYGHAQARGAKIYGEIVGYAMTGDAYHITAPGGNGGLRSMKLALQRAGLEPKDIDYINAHGTSTPVGDMVEFRAVKELFGGTSVSMSSTKGATGHLLGAAGAVEAIYALLAMQRGMLPPTANLADPEEETAGFDLVPMKPKAKEVNIALSNSFGFGGTNGTLIFKKA
ncbi:MAG: beta-ketoacyl-ACP synthase II [Alphaproteobacteria bacterium]|nr:beta-ketoacyl-ACP synthase II [Alphaproteobacteria bacterium]